MQTNDDAIEALKALLAVRPMIDDMLKESDPEQYDAWKRAERLVRAQRKNVSPVKRAA